MSERVMFWLGKPVDELSREELIKVVSELGEKLEQEREMRRDVIGFGSLNVGSSERVKRGLKALAAPSPMYQMLRRKAKA